jgi:hypothetical protein
LQTTRHEHVSRDIHELRSLAGHEIWVVGAEAILQSECLSVDPPECLQRIYKRLDDWCHAWVWDEDPDNREPRPPRRSGQESAAGKHFHHSAECRNVQHASTIDQYWLTQK